MINLLYSCVIKYRMKQVTTPQEGTKSKLVNAPSVFKLLACGASTGLGAVQLSGDQRVCGLIPHVSLSKLLNPKPPLMLYQQCVNGYSHWLSRWTIYSSLLSVKSTFRGHLYNYKIEILNKNITVHMFPLVQSG